MNDYYGRRRYVEEPYEEDRRMRGREPDWERQYDSRNRGPYGPQYGSWSEEDDYAYGGAMRQRSRPRRRNDGDPQSGREYWYERPRQAFDEPYGPAHSPAHMRAAGIPGYWDARPGEERWDDRGYGPAGAPAHTGRYAGRGPKGYQRSPERILDDVADRLTRDPDVDASDMEVSVEGDVVVLRGRVYDRSQKRTAEDVVESVGGVRDVRNELEVERGILETLTDAVSGRSEDEAETRVSHTPPRRNRSRA